MSYYSKRRRHKRIYFLQSIVRRIVTIVRMEQLEEMKKKRIKGIKNGTYLGWHSTEINQ